MQSHQAGFATPAPASPPPLPVISLPRALGDVAIVVAVVLLAGVMAGVALSVIHAVKAALESVDPAEAQAAAVQAISQPGPLATVLLALLSNGLAALVLYFWRGRATPAERAAANAAMTRPATWGWMLGTGLAVVVFSQAIVWLGERSGIVAEPSNVALIEDGFRQSPLFMLAFAVLLAPLYEELLFRRVLFGRLWRAGRPGLGLLLSSATFALLHELPGMSPNPWPSMLLLWLVYAALGAALAWVYRRTGTLWAAIGAHALNNAVACALLLSGHG